MHVDVDVAIVGFGPGGEVLASLLGQAGHRVVVFEKSPAPYGLPRMSTLDGEIARVLQHTSDPAKAMEGTIPQPNYLFYGADGELAVELDWRTPVCGQPARLSLHQPNIEAAMEERIGSCPTVDVRWGREVTGVEDLGDAVRISARTAADSGQAPAEEHVVASYVVGMDGASSFVRRALGIELEVLHTHDDQWYLTDFDILDPAIEPPGTILVMNPDGPYYWGPNGAGRCRTDVRVMGGVDPGELADHDHGYAWLEEHIGIPRDKVRITRRVLYRFRSQYAKAFHKGRIFIGGDAAHAMTPYLAQGSCSAMRDGVNLAWKLDLVLSGRAAPALLDSYETERLPHSAALVHGSLASWALMVEQDPEKVAARDGYLRSGHAEFPPMPILTAGLLHTNPVDGATPPTGALSPQGRVRLGGREDLLDNLVGFGFQLITSEPLDDVLSDDQRRRLDELGVRLVVVGDGDAQAADLDGTYGRFFAEHGATAFLSRPDFYLFGVAESPQATAALVDEMVQQLSPDSFDRKEPPMGPASSDAIERSVARSQITEVLHRYANMAVEQADFAGMAVLFTPDGEFVLPNGTPVPATEIAKVVNGSEPNFIRHHITTIQIDFTSDTTATADSYFIAYTDLAQPDHWGRWQDSFRRELDGRWLLTSKHPVVEGFSPQVWVATVLLPSLATSSS